MTPIEQAKAYALKKTGLNWEKRDKWSDANRTAYLAANAEFRRANAGLFTPAEQMAANNFASTAATKAPEFSYASEFVKEASAQVERINPLSEVNLPGFTAALSKIAGLVAVVVALFFVIKYSPRRAS